MFRATSIGYLMHFNGIFGEFKCVVLGTSMQCFGHFNRMFGAHEWNVWCNFDRIFGAIQCSVLTLQWNVLGTSMQCFGTSMECFGHLNGMFWVLQCNVLVTSM